MSIREAVLPWLQGLSPVVAVVLSGLLVRMTHLNRKRDEDRDAAEDQATRRDQASKVSAWWGESDDLVGTFVRNASDAPVYQTFATAIDADSDAPGAKVNYGTVPPSDRGEFRSVEDLRDVRKGAHRVRLSFTDAAGVRWHRNQYGQLNELPSRLCIKTDAFRTRVLRGFEEEFQQSYGVKMSFALSHGGDSGAQQRYLEGMKSGDIDAVVCPHDWIGSMVASDLIDVMAESTTLRSFFPDWAIDPLTIDGRLYGLPTTADTVALITNTELAEPPNSLDELVEVGTHLLRDGRVSRVAAVRVGPTGDPFQIWPVFASAGGWLFERSVAGEWDLSAVGIDSPESVAALARIRQWGPHGAGILDRSIDADAAFDLFGKARTPFLITSSDAFTVLRDSPVWAKSKVTAVPSFLGGKPATPMMVVHGLVVCSDVRERTTNRITAQDLFADYLTREHVLRALSDGTLAPVAAKFDTSRFVPGFYELCANGAAIPALKSMDAVWRTLEWAELQLISTAGSVEYIAHTTAERIRRLVSAYVCVYG